MLVLVTVQYYVLASFLFTQSSFRLQNCSNKTIIWSDLTTKTFVSRIAGHSVLLIIHRFSIHTSCQRGSWETTVMEVNSNNTPSFRKTHVHSKSISIMTTLKSVIHWVQKLLFTKLVSGCFCHNNLYYNA